MFNKTWSGIILVFILIFGVMFAGCSSKPSGTITTVPTATIPPTKFVAGNIIAPTNSSMDTPLWLIVGYDKTTDQYERTLIYKYTNGTWGYRKDNKTEMSPRTTVEKLYPFKIASIAVSAVPVVTPTVPATVTITPSGTAPNISSIDPPSAGKDATVSILINGKNFQNGATVKLIQPGSPAITGTGIIVATTRISATFNLFDRDKGHYSVVVTNPDGQSATLTNAFTIGEPAPIILTIDPPKGALNATIELIIHGQNFKKPATVTFTKGSDSLYCAVAETIEVTKIPCTLTIPFGTQIGYWNITVVNVADQQSSMLPGKFQITST